MSEPKIIRVDRSHRWAFERGLERGTIHVPEQLKAAFPGILNELVLRLYSNGADSLSMGAVAIEWYVSEQMDLPGHRPLVWTVPMDPLTWENAGSVIRLALQHDLVTEEPGGRGGQRTWRLVSREPKWLVKGRRGEKRAVQVRGLPPVEQEAQYRREATAAKTARTWEQKAREAATAGIAEHLDEILRRWPEATVNNRLLGEVGLDPVYEGRRIDQLRTVLGEHHLYRGMSRYDLSVWCAALNGYRPWPYGWTERTIGGGEPFGVPPGESYVPAPPPAPPPAKIPDADAEALGWL